MAKNMLLQDELARLLKLFQLENIPVVILKGAALLGDIYHDISLRPMVDLDILVPINNLDRAEQIVLREGYSCPVSTWIQENTRKNGQHIPYLVNPEKKVVLEIHHHIVGPESPYRFSIDEFWQNARDVNIGTVTTLVFSPEHTIIHIGIKFLIDRRYHSASSLGQLCDILRSYNGMVVRLTGN
jgi:hypothetical protein